MTWLAKPWRLKHKNDKTEEIEVDSVTTRIRPISHTYQPPSIAPENISSSTWKKKMKKANKRTWSTKYGRYLSEEEEKEINNSNSSSGNFTTGMWVNGRFIKTETFRSSGGATVTYAKRQFAWEEDRWSNYSYNNFYSRDSSSETFIIKEPEGYITPSKDFIQNRLHIYSSKKINEVKNLCRLFYFKMLGETDYLDPEVTKGMSSKSVSDKTNYYAQVYDGYVPGYTPLEQACNYYQQLMDKEAANNHKQSYLGSSTEVATFDRETFSNPDLQTQMRLNKLNKECSISVLNKISLISKLGQEFKVEKEIGEKVVANSMTYRTKNMTSFAQMDRISMYQKVLPTYRHKFLTMALQVNIPVDTSEHKQQLIIILDYSGSMNNQTKQLWVNAILADRLKYVMRGEAEVYFSYFVSDVSNLKFTHLKNAQDVEEFWKRFSNTPNGRCTDMGRIVEAISNEVKNGDKFFNLKGVNLSKDKPEILIINDGQDSCNSRNFPYKVNAISLIEFSDQLKNLCVNTGGKQVKITGDNVISTFTSDGEEFLKEF